MCLEGDFTVVALCVRAENFKSFKRSLARPSFVGGTIKLLSILGMNRSLEIIKVEGAKRGVARTHQSFGGTRNFLAGKDGLTTVRYR